MLADGKNSTTEPVAALPEMTSLRLSEPVRLAALENTKLMDSEADAGFDRLTSLATRLLGAPVSLVSLVDDRRQFFKSNCGLPDLRETPLSHSFCQHVVIHAKPLIVNDSRLDPLVRDNLAVKDLNVIAYLGIPLLSPDGEPLGSFCAIDSKPRDWSDEDVATMTDLAKTVETEISLRLALEDARKSARERDMILREMNHRVKNLFAMVSGMVGLTARDSETPKEMAKQLRGRINALSEAHALIEMATSGQAGRLDSADLQSVAQTILAPHQHAASLNVSGPPFNVDAKGAVRLSLLLHELATNAAKYGAFSEASGQLDVEWKLSDDTLALTWLETTKTDIDPPDSKGFGSRLIDSTVRSLGGTLERDWSTNALRIDIAIPRERIEAAL